MLFDWEKHFLKVLEKHRMCILGKALLESFRETQNVHLGKALLESFRETENVHLEKALLESFRETENVHNFSQ